MKVFVSFDGDHIGRMVGRASLADKPEEVSRIAQAIERGNAIWQSWAESHGGQVINIGGDEGRLCFEADHLQELPKIRDQYSEAVGSTVSVGVGTKLSEADRSLMAAKLQGGDRIQLYTEEVNEILEELKENSESAKLYDEYLDPESANIKKAAPAMNAGDHAGFAGASRSQPAAPQAEGSEHSEAEAARQVYGVEEPQPGALADYESLFHQAAQQTPEDEPQRPSGLQDGVRAQVVQILQDVRGKAQALEEMRQSNPDLYNSVKGLVEAMIAMARGMEGQEQPVQKAEGKVGRCKWKLGERRCQRIVTGDYCHDHQDHWANKINKQKEALRKDLMPGGKGDDRSDSEFDGEQLAAGVKVEMEEHGLDEARAKEVAKDHLSEDPGYYTVKKADVPSDSTDLHIRHLHPDHQAGLRAAKTPKEMSDFIGNNEQAIANHCYGPGEDFLVCDQAASLLSSALQEKKIPHHSVVGFTDDGSDMPDEELEDNGQSHAWIRTHDGLDLDPTGQGTRAGKVVTSWPPPATTKATKPKRAPVKKAALEAGKTGRHQVVLPVGSQVDPGPSSAHEGGEIKVRDPETGKTKWRQVRSGLVMAPDGTPTSSRNPGG